ncbi:expressed unknown protein [Seminavis robusta]|uniref:Uncharacterized protein n=1 Tax=Seminavis robusta TaxID=568900 RepID=A0A9N8EQI2_9STRA|nr:expressed unknown protein [Seminavis robusta]CAB9524580.1 expressed unknown protein [Seminavis robusta]|eukprot:Sro1341_g264490.1 n/a (250) ;mRNA; f:22003-22752
MNPAILLPYRDASTFVPRIDQAPRLMQRQLPTAANAAVETYMMEKPTASKDSSCATPPSPSCVAQQMVCEEPLLTLFATRDAAAVVLQRMVRGTLARWNVRVLQLQHKLAAIQALKEKQLRKLRQRTEQTKRAVKAQHEYVEEHRVVRRRLRRAKVLRTKFAEEKVLLLEANAQLRSQCQQLAQSNDECARILSTYIQNMELAQQNLTCLKVNRLHLLDTCDTYRTIVAVFQRVVGTDEEREPIAVAVE